MNLAVCITLSVVMVAFAWIYLVAFDGASKTDPKGNKGVAKADSKEESKEEAKADSEEKPKEEVKADSEDTAKEEKKDADEASAEEIKIVFKDPFADESEDEDKQDKENDLDGSTLGGRMKKYAKVNVFLLVALAVLIGLSFELNTLFKTNTVIANCKIIILIGFLTVACITDLQRRAIPNLIILIGLGVRVAIAMVELINMGSSYFDVLKNDLIAFVVVSLAFLICGIIVRNGIGMGDVKMVMLMALYQGFVGVFSSLFISMVVAFFIAIFLLITRKKGRKDSIEFAPALFIGTIISAFLSGR